MRNALHPVVNALLKQARKLPDKLYKSLTWDRGKELADHQRFTMETKIAVYFCDPQSPWQRPLLRSDALCEQRARAVRRTGVKQFSLQIMPQ